MTPDGLPVMILCGGLGTRLREETEFKPKPMVGIGDRPLLWHLMAHYASFGNRHFVLCLGYKGEVIKDFFYRYDVMNSDLTVDFQKRMVEFHATHSVDWRVTLADTGLHTGTGARIKRASHYIDSQTFFATYGDGLSDIDLTELLVFHRSHGKLATVLAVQPPARFGELALEGDRVSTFWEKPIPGEQQRGDGGFINGGFFVFERGVLDYLSADEGCALEGEALERLAADGQLMAYKHLGFWQCMDTLRDAERLNRIWASGAAPWMPHCTELRMPTGSERDRP